MIKENIFDLSLPYFDGSQKKVRVFVPEHEQNEKLPVVYMADGQNLFEDDHVKYGCWYTREAVRELQKNSGKSAVIVGIHSDENDVRRFIELLPGSVGRLNYPPDAPKELIGKVEPCGDKYADFVVNTVMPAVSAQFPIKTGRENTAFCGSSMGGLQSFFLALEYPKLFCAAGVFSPAFVYYIEEDLIGWTRSKMHSIGEVPFLYMYMGGADKFEQLFEGSFEKTTGVLEECWPKNKLKKVVMPEKPHHESAWTPVFKDFLNIFL